MDKTQQLDKMQRSVEDKAQQLADMQRSVEDKAQQFADMQQTVRISNKITLKTNSDLKDLQDQYSAALNSREQQDRLLFDLREKLKQASEFFRKVDLQNQVIEGDVTRQKESEIASLKDIERDEL